MKFNEVIRCTELGKWHGGGARGDLNFRDACRVRELKLWWNLVCSLLGFLRLHAL